MFNVILVRHAGSASTAALSSYNLGTYSGGSIGVLAKESIEYQWMEAIGLLLSAIYW